MVPPAPTPSARLVRAAAAERAELGRHRERLLSARESLRAELQAIEASLHELDERDALLDRLAGPPVRSASAVAVGGERPRPASAERAPLRGPAIRRAAVEVLLAQPEAPQALHYRAWFDVLVAEGYEVAGKEPLAVFLTQLSRSPVVRRGTQSGVYELDPGAPRRLRDLRNDLAGHVDRPAIRSAGGGGRFSGGGSRLDALLSLVRPPGHAEGVIRAPPGGPAAPPRPARRAPR